MRAKKRPLPVRTAAIAIGLIWITMSLLKLIDKVKNNSLVIFLVAVLAAVGIIAGALTDFKTIISYIVPQKSRNIKLIQEAGYVYNLSGLRDAIKSRNFLVVELFSKSNLDIAKYEKGKLHPFLYCLSLPDAKSHLEMAELLLPYYTEKFILNTNQLNNTALHILLKIDNEVADRITTKLIENLSKTNALYYNKKTCKIKFCKFRLKAKILFN